MVDVVIKVLTFLVVLVMARAYTIATRRADRAEARVEVLEGLVTEARRKGWDLGLAQRGMAERFDE